MPYFDACLRAGAPRSSLPEELCGAIVYGEQNAQSCAALSSLRPGPWIAAGAPDAFGVIDFQPEGDALIPLLKRPAGQWWTHARQNLCLHFTLPAGERIASGLRNLAGALPDLVLLVDPFALGPEPGWQAKVRMAEWPNIWLTTLGLAPGPEQTWTDPAQIAEAFYFVSGEVGAGKLLFASGAPAGESSEPDAVSWMESIATLDDPQRQLILLSNAKELLRIA